MRVNTLRRINISNKLKTAKCQAACFILFDVTGLLIAFSVGEHFIEIMDFIFSKGSCGI